jgi:hypothetical protein
MSKIKLFTSTDSVNNFIANHTSKVIDIKFRVNEDTIHILLHYTEKLDRGLKPQVEPPARNWD